MNKTLFMLCIDEIHYDMLCFSLKTKNRIVDTVMAEVTVKGLNYECVQHWSLTPSGGYLSNTLITSRNQNNVKEKRKCGVLYFFSVWLYICAHLHIYLSTWCILIEHILLWIKKKNQEYTVYQSQKAK